MHRLLTLDGALVGSAGTEEAADPKVVSAIAAHTWREYIHAGKECNPGQALQFLLVDLEVCE